MHGTSVLSPMRPMSLISNDRYGLLPADVDLTLNLPIKQMDGESQRRKTVHLMLESVHLPYRA